jgi:hypothetical protein
MRIVTCEEELYALPDIPAREAAIMAYASIQEEIGAICGGEDPPDYTPFDAGEFVILEEGDDLNALPLFGPETASVRFSDVEGMLFESVTLSPDGRTFRCFQATNDDGGPTYFLPNEDWVTPEIRTALLAICDDEGKTPVAA